MPTSEPQITAESFQNAFADDLAKERHARKLHAQTTVVLGYCNVPISPTADGFDTASILGNGGGFCQQTLSRLLLGGVKVLVWSPGLPSWQSDNLGIAGREKVDFILGQIQAVHDLSKQTDGLLEVARTIADIRRINEKGGVAILLHLSGANHLNDMGVLREYYDMGVRIIHAGFQDWPEDGGKAKTVQFGDDPQERIYHAGKLNEHGRRTLEEMKRLGMVVDVAHIRPDGFDDVAQLMEGVPFIYSHGACATLAPGWWRNLDDSRISKIATNGGVYGIGPYLWPKDLSRDPHTEPKQQELGKLRRAREQKIQASAANIRDYIRQRFSHECWGEWEITESAKIGAYNFPTGSLSAVVAHMTYVRQQFGADAVGYGPDYEYSFGYARGLEEADKTPNLTRALLDAGWTDDDVQKAMGHNFMRVFENILS